MLHSVTSCENFLCEDPALEIITVLFIIVYTRNISLRRFLSRVYVERRNPYNSKRSGMNQKVSRYTNIFGYVCILV